MRARRKGSLPSECAPPLNRKPRQGTTEFTTGTGKPVSHTADGPCSFRAKKTFHSRLDSLGRGELLFCYLPRRFPQVCFDHQNRSSGNGVEGTKKNNADGQTRQAGNDKLRWSGTSRATTSLLHGVTYGSSLLTARDASLRNLGNEGNGPTPYFLAVFRVTNSCRSALLLTPAPR